MLLLLAFTVSPFLQAHDLRNEDIPAPTWHLNNGKTFNGWYLKSEYQNYIFDCGKGVIKKINAADLMATDVAVINQKKEHIYEINQAHQTNSAGHHISWITILIILILGFSMTILFRNLPQAQRIYIIPIAIFGGVMFLSAFTLRVMKKQASLGLLDSSFAPFVPYVHTFSGSTYYNIESKGIPETHEMMVGISDHGWQQQVPIPQCYIGANSWQVPLHPTPAASPIPVDSIHFTRGAIAIAVNGVPIFNVHTNTGVDSYLDGQLDNYGGHCGRADDYHYHIAPLHLYKYTSQNLPIAWGLDGYPIFGASEPDGSSMKALDNNHGHLWGQGDYHYHGTATAPYMIAAMYGQVTEDNTHQLIPQPAAKPIRPALTPLKGALITSCKARPQKDGYTLLYTLKGVTDSITFFWDMNGNYTFQFYNSGVLTTQNYKGFVPCAVPYNGITKGSRLGLSVYPVPANTDIFLQVAHDFRSQISKMSLTDSEGRIVWEQQGFTDRIERGALKQGIYFLSLYHAAGTENIKVMLQ